MGQQLLAALDDHRAGQVMMAVPRVDRVEQRHPDVVDQTHRVERFWQLKAAREAKPRAFVGDQPVDRPPVKDNGAGLVVQRAGEAVDQG